MTKHYLTIYIVLLCTYCSFGQISKNDNLSSRPIFTDFTNNNETENCFCFEFYSDPSALLSLYNNIASSQLDSFYDDQRDAIQEEIEERLNDDFNNYEDAVKELFRQEATLDFENDYINSSRNSLPAQISHTRELGQLTHNKSLLFHQVWGNNNSIDFEGLRHNNTLLENMDPNQAWYLYNDFYGTQMNELHSEAGNLIRDFNGLGIILANNSLSNYLTNEMYDHHRSYSAFKEIQQINGYLIYYANTNQPGPFNNTPGLFDGINYLTYDHFTPLSNAIIDNLIDNSGAVVTNNPYWEVENDIEQLKYDYSTEQENLGLATYNFLQDYPNLIDVSANFMSNEEYSNRSIDVLKEIFENFRYDDPLISNSLLSGTNVSLQTQDRPDRIFYMQWGNSAINQGYSNTGILLEGLSNIPNNYSDGAFIERILNTNYNGTLPDGIDYGLLFDFNYTAGGISIVFSPYALEHIIGDLEHADGIYGWDLFEDPFKIDALITIAEGGEADFSDEILKDQSFIGTQIDCVLNALINSNNNIWKRVSEAFTPNDSEYKIKFTTYNDPNDLANARTGIPDENGIISIEFNLSNISGGSLEIATDILHETFHAELHRIHFSNNAPPNSLPQEQFDWFEQLWNFYSQSNNTDNGTAADSEHFFIAQYLINPIAMGLQEFDSYSHPLNNYKFPAWSGLNDFGLSANYINQSELDELANLYSNVLNDNNEPPCN